MIKKLIKPVIVITAALIVLLHATGAIADPGIVEHMFTLPDFGKAMDAERGGTSLHMLYQLFGPIFAGVYGKSNGMQVKDFLFADVLQYWNFLIASGAGAFITYHIMLGFIRSAENGKFLGGENEKVGSILRYALGGFLVAPVLPGSACGMQAIFMTAILYGVHMANLMWGLATQDIELGATPTIPSNVTSTINNIAGRLYLYEQVDSGIAELLSGTTEKLSNTGVTSTALVNLEDQQGFESVAHALSDDHSYHTLANLSGVLKEHGNSSDVFTSPEKHWGQTFRWRAYLSKYKNAKDQTCTSGDSQVTTNAFKGCKPNDSHTPGIMDKSVPLYTYVDQYQPGEWVVSGVLLLTSGNNGLSSGVQIVDAGRHGSMSSGDLGFEKGVLIDHAGVSSNPADIKIDDKTGEVTSSIAVGQVGVENKREKALIEPFGFELGAVATNWSFPILSDSGPLVHNLHDDPCTDAQTKAVTPDKPYECIGGDCTKTSSAVTASYPYDAYVPWSLRPQAGSSPNTYQCNPECPLGSASRNGAGQQPGSMPGDKHCKIAVCSSGYQHDPKQPLWNKTEHQWSLCEKIPTPPPAPGVTGLIGMQVYELTDSDDSQMQPKFGADGSLVSGGEYYKYRVIGGAKDSSGWTTSTGFFRNEMEFWARVVDKLQGRVFFGICGANHGDVGVGSVVAHSEAECDASTKEFTGPFSNGTCSWVPGQTTGEGVCVASMPWDSAHHSSIAGPYFKSGSMVLYQYWNGRTVDNDYDQNGVYIKGGNKLNTGNISTFPEDEIVNKGGVTPLHGYLTFPKELGDRAGWHMFGGLCAPAGAEDNNQPAAFAHYKVSAFTSHWYGNPGDAAACDHLSVRRGAVTVQCQWVNNPVVLLGQFNPNSKYDGGMAPGACLAVAPP